MKTTYTFNQEEMEKIVSSKLTIAGIKPTFRWNVQENTDMRGEKIGIGNITLAVEIDYAPTQKEFESGPFQR